jgi:hypothetical protein
MSRAENYTIWEKCFTVRENTLKGMGKGEKLAKGDRT